MYEIHHSTPSATRNPLLDEPCSNPQQLLNTRTGQETETRCGSRFSETCPSCAYRYQITERAILEAGQPPLPEPASNLPQPLAVFLTLTMGSFGQIAHHAPRFPRQYRYGAQIITSACEPELMRTFNMALHRATADWQQAGYRLSYRGSREIQTRGAGHYHLLITLSVPEASSFNPTLLPTLPTAEDLASRIKNLNLTGTAVPQDLQNLAAAPHVQHRRTQLGLPPASPSTLRIPARISFGTQIDAQIINLHSDAQADPQSYARKASYLSKALTYLVKDLDKSTTASQPGAHKNRRHLQRLANESFALLADTYLTQCMSTWLTHRIEHETATIERQAATAATLAAGRTLIDELNDTITHRAPIHPSCQNLGYLYQVLDAIPTITSWELLDKITPADFLLFDANGTVLPRSAKFTRLNADALIAELRHGSLAKALAPSRPAHTFLLNYLTDSHGKGRFLSEEGHSLLRSIRLKLRKLVTSHGHTGSCTVSSRWPVTKSQLRANYRNRLYDQARTDYRQAQKEAARHSAPGPAFDTAQAQLTAARAALHQALEAQGRHKVRALERQAAALTHQLARTLSSLSQLHRLQAQALTHPARYHALAQHIGATYQQINDVSLELETTCRRIRQLRTGVAAHIWVRLTHRT